MRCLPILLSLASFALAQDPERFEIRRGVKPGAKSTRTLESRGEGTISAPDAREFGCSLVDVEEVVEEVLEAKEGRAQKAKRMYRRKESVFQVPDLEKKEEKTSSLTGRLLTLERKDGKTTATCAEKNINPAELASETLDDEWDIPLSPPAAVAVGDEWKPDAPSVKSWASARGRKVDESSLSCKLDGIETVAGRRCARIEIDFSAKGTIKGSDKQPGKSVDWTLKGPAWWSLDDGRIVKFGYKGDLKLDWDAGPKGGPAQPWCTKTKIRLEGTSTPGEANFEQVGPGK